MLRCFGDLDENVFWSWFGYFEVHNTVTCFQLFVHGPLQIEIVPITAGRGGESY